MILCIGPTPAAQRVMVFHRLLLDAVNRAATTLDGAAGKSVNVAKVLKALGEQPIATGFLGGNRGEYIGGVLLAKGIEGDFVKVAAGTRQCVTVIDEGTGAITELVEESRPVPDSDYELLLEIITRRVRGCRAVVVSGTITPGGPVDFYRRCVASAREAGAIPVVDATGPALVEALKARPGLVKPNRAELMATLGRELENESDVVAAMRELQQRGAERVVVTAGKDPALALDSSSAWRIRSARIRPVNPIGSGDAFTAGLVWRLARGETLGEACRWAAAAGAANALSLLPGELDLQDVERLARETRVTPL